MSLFVWFLHYYYYLCNSVMFRCLLWYNSFHLEMLFKMRDACQEDVQDLGNFESLSFVAFAKSCRFNY